LTPANFYVYNIPFVIFGFDFRPVITAGCIRWAAIEVCQFHLKGFSMLKLTSVTVGAVVVHRDSPFYHQGRVRSIYPGRGGARAEVEDFFSPPGRFYCPVNDLVVHHRRRLAVV